MSETFAILIVDHDEDSRQSLTRTLTKEGYLVETAADGEEALDKLGDTPFDLVVTDIAMPRLNGFELLKIIKQRFPQIGVIVMTTHGDVFTVKDALLMGADEYITKPFKSYEIDLIIERACWRLQAARKDAPHPRA